MITRRQNTGEADWLLTVMSHDPRRLWRHVNSVLCRGRVSGLSPAPVSHSADDFQRFFVTKVETVRAATAESSGAVSTEVNPVNRRSQR